MMKSSDLHPGFLGLTGATVDAAPADVGAVLRFRSKANRIGFLDRLQCSPDLGRLASISAAQQIPSAPAYGHP
jgi:hypothetical protein